MHTKTRQVLRRLHAGQYDAFFTSGVYSCPFYRTSLAGTDFNSLLKHVEGSGSGIHKGGQTINVYAYIAEHQALGIHLQNLQWVAIKEGRMPPIKPKAPKIKGLGSKKWRKRQREEAEAQSHARRG